ncbi:MAG: hypothetical protein IPQ19_06875 [Bacteroidetes bacterium]|nr:hypothetical protein [Bacteroidota bacterium]
MAVTRLNHPNKSDLLTAILTADTGKFGFTTITTDYLCGFPVGQNALMSKHKK